MDDLISRQAAIDAILHNQEVYSNNFGDDPIDKYTIAIIDNDAQTIAQLPSAQPERKKGKWVKNPNSEYAPPVCSECGHECAFVIDCIEAGQGTRQDIKRYLSNFCPNCGADMRGRTNDRNNS